MPLNTTLHTTLAHAPLHLAVLLAAGALAAPLAAEPREAEAIARAAQVDDAAQSTGSEPLARFAPARDRTADRLDYTHWDEALRWFVVPMGPSIREGARTVEPRLGTRIVYGHESRYRLEGNRVAFSFLTPEITQAISDYRADLERIGTELDLTRLPRNEQLAFWLNLHNVAVIEALAGEFPLGRPDQRSFGSNSAPLDEARLVTVKGVALSPRDIRERIVYPNWNDPKVIYGFWRGIIGGPSIQRLAYNGNNVDILLSLAGEEFVNSLRGVEHFSGALQVSGIYEEAARFYFADDADLRAHLAQFAGEDVQRLLDKGKRVAFKELDGELGALADLARGERDPALGAVCGGSGGAVGALTLGIGPEQCVVADTRPNAAIQRLMAERAQKLNRAIDRGIRTGSVVIGLDNYDPDAPPREVQ